MRVDEDFVAQMSGKGVLTTEILYYRPDFRCWLQSFVWQCMDEAPRFPRLAQFLDHWRREVDAVIHSIRIAHADWVGPIEIRPINGAFRLN